MRDLLAIMDDRPARGAIGPRDLLAIMGDEPPDEPMIEEPGFLDRIIDSVSPYLSDIGAGFKAEAEAQGAAGRMGAATAGGLLVAPVAGMAGLAKTITSGITEGGKTYEGIASLPGKLVQTPEEAAILEGTVGTAMKPFQMAGEGLQEIVRLTPAKDTIAEPIAGAIGEIAAIFGTGGAGRAFRARLDSMPYRKRVAVVEGIKADLASGEFTGAQIRDLWKDPANREVLLKRYQGVGAEEGRPSKPAFNEPPSGKALPPGQGFELGSRGARDILAEMGETRPALPYPEGVGEGFASRPGVPEEPIVKKSGEPFKTEQSATQAGKGLDWNLYEVTQAEGGGYQITRKAGQEIRTPDAPKTDWMRELRARSDAEQAERMNAPPVAQAETSPVEMTRAPSPPEIVQSEPNLPPAPTGEMAPHVPEEKPVSSKGPENLVTYLQKKGFVRLGEYSDRTGDAWDRTHGRRTKDRSREMGDIAAVARNNGALSMDEAATIANSEGWGIWAPDGREWTPNDLFNALADGKGRNIFTPERAEDIIVRKLRGPENEWIENQLADLEKADPEAVENKADLQRGLIDEIKAEGFDFTDEKAALREIEDFFNEVKISEPTPEWIIWRNGGKEYIVKATKREESEAAEWKPDYYGEDAPPPSARRPKNHAKIIAAVPDKPWEWTSVDLADLRPSERGRKLEKIWGPEEEFERWTEGKGQNKRRHDVSLIDDLAADLDYAVKESDNVAIDFLLKKIRGFLEPQDYYAYEEVQKPRRNAPVSGNADRTNTGGISETGGADSSAVSARRHQENLPGITGSKDVSLVPPSGSVGRYPAAASRKPSAEQQSLFEKRRKYFQENGTLDGFSEAETFGLANPKTEIFRGPMSKKDMTPTEDLFNKPKGPIGSERGSIPINESEVLSAILKTQGKIKDAMPHLETLGRSVYDSGKTRFLDWQASIKTKLGDLWESFKAHLKGIFDRLQSGKIGPLGNQKGAVGVDINKGPVIKQREIKDAKTKEVRLAPPVYKSEFEAVKKMPELRQKPLGGWLENPLRTFEELGPEIKELFYRPVKEGEHLAKKHFKQIHEKSESIRKKLPRGSSERIGTYAISQQKGGAQILEAMGIKNVPKLTPEEMKAYEWMRGGLETFYGKLQEARAKAGKEGFGHVENYFTFARQFTLMEEMGFSPIFARIQLLQNVMHRKTTPFQYEKHRVGGLTRADLDAFGIFDRYMESATRHYYLSPAIAKGREMLLTFHEGDAKWILRDEKPGAAKFITEWLDHQAGQRKPQLPNLIEKGLTKLNKNLAFSILSANIRSALIQPTAILNTAAEIGPKWTAEGIKSLFDNTAVEKSNVLLSRQFDISVTESMAGLPGKLGKARQAVGNVGMKPLQFLDMQTAKVTWHGAYKKGKSEGMAEEAARNYADDTVTRTQGSAMPSDLSPAQRTALGKALTLFQTFVINQWNFLTRDVMGIGNPSIKSKAAVKKTATFIVGATLINMFYEDLLGLPSPLPSPISAFVDAMDKGEDIPSASLDAATEIASLIPIVGGGFRYGSSMLGAPAEFVGDIGKKLAPNYVGPTRSAGELVAKGLGIPGTAQLVKSLRIANKGGSPADVVLGRYPEKEARLVQPFKTLKGGLK